MTELAVIARDEVARPARRRRLTRLGLMLRLYRESTGLAQVDVARQVGCSASTVNDFETGASALRSTTLVKLVDWAMRDASTSRVGLPLPRR